MVELANAIRQSLVTNSNQTFRFLEGKQLELEVAQDVEIVNRCLNAMDKLSYVTEGEWVRNGEEFKQVAKVLDTVDGVVELQLGGGNHYLTELGGCYSGSLDHPIKVRLRLTGERKLGEAWIFHLGESGASRGVYFKVPYRVWEVV